MLVVTHSDCVTYETPGHPEAPFRVEKTREHLNRSRLDLHWLQASEAPEEALLAAHDPGHLALLRERKTDFDPDTPYHEKIALHASRSAGAALACLDHVLASVPDTAFSLMRPPGHHATRSRAMGFCYLNQIAIAALAARRLGVEKVAVFDFDVHHGNGTEAILRKVPGTALYSVHQHPCYPGTGVESSGNCHNYPVMPHASRHLYQDTLAEALEDLLSWKPGLILVSAGFDAYCHDPIAQESLETEDFFGLGRKLRQTGLPFLSVLEGGYSKDLPLLIEAYLRGCLGS